MDADSDGGTVTPPQRTLGSLLPLIPPCGAGDVSSNIHGRSRAKMTLHVWGLASMCTCGDYPEGIPLRLLKCCDKSPQFSLTRRRGEGQFSLPGWPDNSAVIVPNCATELVQRFLTRLQLCVVCASTELWMVRYKMWILKNLNTRADR